MKYPKYIKYTHSSASNSTRSDVQVKILDSERHTVIISRIGRFGYERILEAKMLTSDYDRIDFEKNHIESSEEEFSNAVKKYRAHVLRWTDSFLNPEK